MMNELELKLYKDFLEKYASDLESEADAKFLQSSIIKVAKANGIRIALNALETKEYRTATGKRINDDR